eukprot:3932071-Rhodomonas_salina.1
MKSPVLTDHRAVLTRSMRGWDREVVIARPERESTILPLRAQATWGAETSMGLPGGGVMEERGGPEAVLVRGGSVLRTSYAMSGTEIRMQYWAVRY